MLEEVLEEIYQEKVKPQKGEIPQKYFEANRDKFEEATAKGMAQSRNGEIADDKEFLGKYRHSIDVFSAFRSHEYAQRMADELYDSEGKIRPFEEWRRLTESIQSHFNRSWLVTEYNTAVLRAEQAADWRMFEKNKKDFPRLKWMPTSSANPRELHKSFWSIGLTLPVDDPFWNKHHPGDLWNCKCYLEPTTEKETPKKERPKESDSPKPADGLEENPGKTKAFVSPKHPYYPNPESCIWLKIANGGVKNGLMRKFMAYECCDGECNLCKYVKIFGDKSKNEKFFKEIENDSEFIKKEMNEKGGVRAESIHHKKNPNKDRFFKDENDGKGWKGTELEIKCQDHLFNNGHSCILMPEGLPDGKGGELTALDSKIDGIRMDIKSVTSNNTSYINQVTGKFDQLNSWNKQNPNDKTDYLCIYIHNKSLFSREKLKSTIEKATDMRNKGKDFPINHLYVVVNGIEELIKVDL